MIDIDDEGGHGPEQEQERAQVVLDHDEGGHGPEQQQAPSPVVIHHDDEGGHDPGTDCRSIIADIRENLEALDECDLRENLMAQHEREDDSGQGAEPEQEQARSPVVMDHDEGGHERDNKPRASGDGGLWAKLKHGTPAGVTPGDSGHGAARSSSTDYDPGWDGHFEHAQQLDLLRLTLTTDRQPTLRMFQRGNGDPQRTSIILRVIDPIETMYVNPKGTAPPLVHVVSVPKLVCNTVRLARRKYSMCRKQMRM